MRPEWLDSLICEVLDVLSNENEETYQTQRVQIRQDPAIGTDGWSVRIFVSGFVPILSILPFFEEGTVDVLACVSEASVLGTVKGREETVQLDFDFNEPVVRRPTPVGASSTSAQVIDLNHRRGRSEVN